MGRKKEEIDIDKSRFLELVKQGLNHKQACDEVGISHTTFYNWKREDRQFLDDYEFTVKSKRVKGDHEEGFKRRKRLAELCEKELLSRAEKNELADSVMLDVLGRTTPDFWSRTENRRVTEKVDEKTAQDFNAQISIMNELSKGATDKLKLMKKAN